MKINLGKYFELEPENIYLTANTINTRYIYETYMGQVLSGDSYQGNRCAANIRPIPFARTIHISYNTVFENYRRKKG